MGITRKHSSDQALLLQSGDSCLSILLQRIANHKLADKGRAFGYQHLTAASSCFVGFALNTKVLHQLGITTEHALSTKMRYQALAGNLFKAIRSYQRESSFLRCLHDALGNGMGRNKLCTGGILQKLRFAITLGCLQGLQYEITLGHGAGFIHNHGLHML